MSDRARQHGHQRIAPSPWHGHDTQMCRAFPVALARWVFVNHGNPAARVVLPIGCVGVGELHSCCAPSKLRNLIKQQSEFYRRATISAYSKDSQKENQHG